MGVRFEHEVEESQRKNKETTVDIRTSDVVGCMRCGEAGESYRGLGDDGGDNEKRGEGSIKVGR